MLLNYYQFLLAFFIYVYPCFFSAVLAVGRIAAQWLLQTDAPIGRLRGRVFRYGDAGTPLVVTYHPAYLLRSPLQKATAWTDLCMVKELLQTRA